MQLEWENSPNKNGSMMPKAFRQYIKKTLLLGTVIFAALLFHNIVTRTSKDHMRIDGSVLGTSYHITYISPNDKNLKPAIDSLFNEIHHSLASYIDGSLVTRVNATQDTSKLIEVDEHFARVFRQVNTINQDSLSANRKKSLTSNSGQVQSRNSLREFRHLSLVRKKGNMYVRKNHPEAWVPFEHVAIGYAVDRAAALFQDRGIRNFLIDVGGTIRSKGKNQHGNWWQVLIPQVRGRKVLDDINTNVVKLKNRALATKIVARFVYSKQGDVQSINTDSLHGKHKKKKLISITVFANTCVQAEVLAAKYINMSLRASRDNALQKDSVDIFQVYTEPGIDTFNTRYTEPLTNWLVDVPKAGE